MRFADELDELKSLREQIKVLQDEKTLLQELLSKKNTLLEQQKNDSKQLSIFGRRLQ